MGGNGTGPSGLTDHQIVAAMQRDPTLRSLSDSDIEEAIMLYDAIFDDRAQRLSLEQQGAVRAILSILNGELAERNRRSSVHISTTMPKLQEPDGWIRRLFR